jgi:hypothetical protein
VFFVKSQCQSPFPLSSLKSPSIRTPKFIKKISFNFKIFISFQTGFHIYSAQPFY